MHNIRVMRNMMINSASHPFCNQPSIGGPVYWVRNIAYNAPFGAARMTSGAPGVLFINNTIFSEFAAATSGNLHMFNNLILGEKRDPRRFSRSTPSPAMASPITTAFVPIPGPRRPLLECPGPGMMQDYHDLLQAVADSVRRSRRASRTRWCRGSIQPWLRTAPIPIRINTASWSITTCSRT